MRVPFTLIRPNGERIDLCAEVEGLPTIGELIRAGSAYSSFDGPVHVDGRVVHLDDPLDTAGLRPGSLVALGQGGAAKTERMSDPAELLHLAVIAGPCGGLLAALPPGPAVVGRSGECDIRIPDPAVSARHFRIERHPDGAVSVDDLGSRNGLSLDGETVVGTAVLREGQRLVAGDSVIELRPGSPADAVLHKLRLFHELRRPPRLRPASPDAPIDWPQPPPSRNAPVVPLASALLPVVLGLVMLLVTGSVLMLLFILLTPMLVVANFVTAKRSGRRESAQQNRAYAEARARAEADLTDAQRAEVADRLAEHPDPATLLATALGPRRRLWERRAADPDFLDVRVGTATLDSMVRLVGSGGYVSTDRQAPPVAGVPCVVSLRDSGVLGVCGPAGVAGPAAAWMVAQQVILSGPADLRLVVLAEAVTSGHDRWGWSRWLPHVASSHDSEADPSGSDAVETRARRLVEVVESRLRDLLDARASAEDIGWTWIVAVLDRAHDIRRIAGMDVVLQQGPTVRVVSICVEEAESLLPPECRTVVSADESGTAALMRSGQAMIGPVDADRVPTWWCETVGRALAPIADPEMRSGAGRIPAEARLVDLLGLDGQGPVEIAERWRGAGRSTVAVVGVGGDGPFRLDLLTDGPHGLVAGTTGAGKSELLQTLVASLAVANRPDAMNFLLVDYKGGSAFRDCSRLPHTVGVVTDLDGHLVERALVSLSAELKRREDLLARAAAKDVDDYVTLGEPLGVLPRLVIVIDEFAGLVAELPDFVTGLVGIAQRGRSLGIHLILATQRPGGVVSPEIRANTNLRVALRVVSPAESVDIIDAPDAARISPGHPGRAYARTGHSALSPFQTARVGGPADASGRRSPSQVSVAPLAWAGASGSGVSRSVEKGSEPGRADPTDTDLARLATILGGAAARAGIAAQRQPWLPPLPDLVTIGALSGSGHVPRSGLVVPVPAGLVDLPSAQRQEPWLYDPRAPRHLLIAGSPGSGRTTALRSLAVALASGNHPDDLWIYVVDCGGGELRRLADLPHCGAVVTRSEADRTGRLLARLHLEMSRRLEMLAARGHADLAEHRDAVGSAGRPPYIVVLVDRWEGFMAALDPVDGGRLTEIVLDLAREGGSVGIRVVVTGDRQLLLGKLAGTVEDRLCLNLAESADYSMAGLDPRRAPPVMAPGRALRTGDQAELQIAIPGTGRSGSEQTSALAELSASWRERHDGEALRRPFRIDALPDRVDLASAGQLPTNRTEAAHWALLGVGGDELTAVGMDLLASGGFVVAGPRRSGRSSALVVMARSLIGSGSMVLAICPRPSPLRRLAGVVGVVGVVNGDSPSVADTLALVNSVEGPLVVLVDDAYLLHNSDLSELLEAISRDGPEQGHVMVVAGTAEDLSRPMRGFITEVRQSRTGLLLCPESHLHGEVVGVRLPRSSVFSRPPGRGVLVAGDGLLTIQVSDPSR